jgi:addiction module RelE/StbE family toxin
VKLEWSILALTDRESIFDYIAAESPRSAILVDERIHDRVEQLVQFPLSGRPGRVADTRELVIARTPLVAVYVVKGRIVRILRILHTARRWPPSGS